ncbi:hemocytin isoform X1 [Rhipicephalus microplus]|uniref:hemocytin isoform X1 n=1 Tax=Rhipicephalus microplus TaxID=6941 RepID=UPI003F6BC602
MFAPCGRTCLCWLLLVWPLLGVLAEEKYRFFRKTAKGLRDEIEETCSQPCQNGGKCYKERCACTPGFRGQYCEYPLSLCDLQRAGFHGTSQCNHTRLASTCVLECNRGLKYEYLPPTNVYKCSAAGEWSPPNLPRCVDETQERLKKAASPSRRPSSGTCAVWGRGHYRTFDGSLFSFRSRCRHLLAHECRGDTFSVHVGDSHCSNDSARFFCRRSLDIYVEGQRFGFELDPPRVTLGNVSAPIPTTLEGLRVDYVARRIVISSQLGFTVTWNGEDLVEVSVDASLKGSMCGLCGQYDDDPTNDFVNSHGRQVTSRSAFLDSWKRNDLEEDCEDIFFDPSKQRPSEELVLEARRLCSRVTDKRFAACHKVVDPKPYGDMCLEDYVSCLGDRSADCRCSALAEYFRECERLGGKLESVWRRHDFCPARCPAGMVYTQCGASCTRTCRDPDASCESRPCVDGCHCPAGTLLHDGRCVRREQCPCSLHAREYKPGSLVKQECNSCECSKGEWRCTTKDCPSRCVANGDPFFSTFDGKTFEFRGRCPYYLVRSQNFSIVQETGHCHEVEVSSGKGFRDNALDCSKMTTVTMTDSTIVIAHEKVFVNGEKVKLPFSSDIVVVYRPSSEVTQASFSNGIVLQWNRKGRLHIDSPASLSGQLRGLCGTNNRNQKDDFLTPAGDVEGNVRTFVDKWKVDASCDEEDGVEEHPCERSPQRASRAKDLCKEIYGEAFKECQLLVDPEPYYKACLHQTCACRGSLKDCVCPSLAEYAAECARKGRLTQWRRHFSLCSMRCPSDMKWSECARQKSCFEVALGETANSTCVEGCVCKDGYEKDQLCLTADYCSCLHKHKLYAPGTMHKMNGQLCECDNGEWDCMDEEGGHSPDLPPPSIFEERTSSQRCAHDANSEYTECLDACPLTCDNVNADASCGNNECQPGCRCKLGFVLQPSTNSCVPQSECGCKHGGKVFPPSSEIQRDCNKCTCSGGLWECDKKDCPGVCTAWGESHFNSFDGHIYDFRSDCELMMAKGRLSDGSQFEVTLQSMPCAAGDNVCKRTARIVARGQELITLGASKNLPVVRFGPGYLLRETTLHVTVFTDVGLIVQWDKGTTVSLAVQPTWRGRVKGLCGNFDGDQTNDFQTPSGGVAEGDVRVFGDAWKLQEACRNNGSLVTDGHEVCEHRPHRTAWATQRCEVLRSPLFEPCHMEVDVDPYFERCVQDVCGCDSGGDCECLCTNIAAYAHECSAQGIHIKWRSQSLCPIQCDAECSEYVACISGCPPRTCETLGSPLAGEKTVCDNSTAPCIEGCRPKPCPEGFVYDNEHDMNCVPEAQCRVPCKEINGRVYLEGERIEDARIAEPCESCFCRRGSIVCTGHPCPNTEPPVEVSCTASGWTPWLNPAARASGDFALLADPRFASLYGPYCGAAHVVGIECRVSATGQDLLGAGQMASCELPRGLSCYHRYQAGGACLDYEVRLLCDCEYTVTSPSVTEGEPSTNQQTTYFVTDSSTVTPNPTAVKTETTSQEECSECAGEDTTSAATTSVAGAITSTTPAPTPSTETEQPTDHVRDATPTPGVNTITPDVGKAGPPAPGCVSHWTEFYNIDSPDVDDGDVESLEDIKELFAVCEGLTIEDVDCMANIGDNMTDYRNTGDVGVKCSKGTGLVCLNWLQPRGRKCHDYAIRFFCKCDVEYEGTTGTHEFTVTTSLTTERQPQTWEPTTAFVTDHPKVPITQPPVTEGSRLTEATGTRSYGGHTDAFAISPFTSEGRLSTETTYSTAEPRLHVVTEGIPPISGSTCYPGWSAYIDTDNPNTEDGDFEFVSSLEERACRVDEMKAIECKAVRNDTGELIDWLETGDKGVTCLKEKGLLCFNNDQDEGRQCHNYKIRVFCVCTPGDVPPVFTLVPTTAGLPTTTEEALPMDEGWCGWTEWMDTDDPHTSPEDMGDFEILEELGNRYNSCAPGHVDKIECRVKSTGQDWTQSGQSSLSCDTKMGFRCYNKFQLGVCEDYEVRLFCSCPGPVVPEDKGKKTTYAPSTPVTDQRDSVATETTTKKTWFSTLRTTIFGGGTETPTTEVTSTVEPEKTSTTVEPETTPLSSEVTSPARTEESLSTTEEPRGEPSLSTIWEQSTAGPTTVPAAVETHTLSTDATTTFRTTPTIPTTGICPKGRTYSDCAYRCNQTCNLFLRALVSDRKCLGDDWCVPGCRPTSGCEAPRIWLDYDTCIEEEECSCSFEGQVLGANQVVDRDCERCICQDNQIVCATEPDCRPLPTGLPQVSVPTTGIPAIVTEEVHGGSTCVPGWSMWFNTRKPDEHGDVESADAIRARGLPLCDERFRTEVQCEPLDRNVVFEETHRIRCDIQNGLACRNDPQNDDTECPDYMVRFYCDCFKGWENTPVIVRLPTVPTTPTVTTKPTTPAVTPTTPAASDTQTTPTVRTVQTALPISTIPTAPPVVPGEDFTTPTDIIYDQTTVQYGKDKCSSYVYLVNGPFPLPDSSYKASSSASMISSPRHSRLGSRTSSSSFGAWMPRYPRSGEYIEVDLGRLRSVFGIALQGRERTRQWVTRYRVLVSADGTQYAYVQNSEGKIQDFVGNHDSNGVSRQLFDQPVRARFVRIEPTAWNELIALRFDVLGCTEGSLDYIPPRTTPFVPTTNAPETATVFVRMCPELPETLRPFCPICPDGMLCDGADCVPASRCACFQEGQLFHVNKAIVTSKCDICMCTLSGISKCRKMQCTCPKTQRAYFDDKCQCKCAHCPFGQRVCPTTNECIDEFKWCNGVKDCPDDEQGCDEIEQPPAISPCTEPTKPVCPDGQEPKLISDMRCPEYKCVPTNGDGDVCRLLSNAAVCTIEGRSVKTFDGQRFMHDVCDHILFQDRVNKQFSVTAHRRCSRSGATDVCEAWVSIMCNGTFVKLGPSLSEVSVNGKPVSVRNLGAVSKRLGDVHLARSGQRLVFTSVRHNFEVAFDERRTVKVSVSDCLSSKTSGLCGLFDWDASNEFRTPDSRLVDNAQDFAKSWATSGAAALSCKQPTCPKETREKAERWCQRIAAPPLSRCTEDKNLLKSSVSTCADQVCDCVASGDDDVKKCMCNAIEGFVSTCKAAVRSQIASEWRLSLGCAPECPAGMEWRECGPSSECEPTCDNVHRSKNTAEECPEECVAGCFCPLGLVRRGDACVPPSMCHDCVCRGHGDPNYISFDGRTFDFQGNCSYVLAQHISGDKSLDFQVVGVNVECPEEPRTTCTQGVIISYGDNHVRVSRGQRVQFDDRELQDKEFPWSQRGFNISWVPGRTTVVYVPAINLVVRYFELNYGFSIEVPSFTYSGKMTGLCGDCDLDESNDLQHRSGYQVAEVRDFAYSWLVEGSPEICTVLRSSSQRLVPPEVCRFQENACELYVEPDAYQKACLSDASYSRNLSASVCRSKLQYAEHCCATAGVSVHRWLQDSGCDFSCPKNMELRCDTGCPKTCANYKEPDSACPVMPTYSCFCKRGFVLKNGECVDARHCESCDDQGHLVGESWQVSPCETCGCGENLKIRCTSIICPPPPVCRDDEKLQQLPKQNGTCCETYLCDANLISSCKAPEPVVCLPGAITKIKTDSSGCPTHVCECDQTRCPPLQWPVGLEPGLEAFIEDKGCCKKVSVRCNVNNCPGIPTCPPETELENAPGECCTIYKCVPKNKCAYIHKYKVVNGMQVQLHPEQRYQKMYPVDSSWTDGLCTNCTCTEHFNQYQYSCKVEVCPSHQKDSEDYEYSASSRNFGVCCPEQQRTACRGGGQTRSIGEEWKLPEEGKCRSYRCERSSTTGEAVKVVLAHICNSTCRTSEKYVEPTPGSGDCCGRCVREYCEEGGKLYQVGETWVSNVRPCFEVKCVRGDNGAVEMKYTLNKCPKLPSNCPRNSIVRDETGCCQICKVTPGACAPYKLPEQQTAQYFFLNDPEHGLCSNAETIPGLAECRGQCTSSTVYSPETSNFTTRCSCCTIMKSEPKKVTLTCEKGQRTHRIQKDYQNPIACKCTPCGKAEASTGVINVPIPL